MTLLVLAIYLLAVLCALNNLSLSQMTPSRMYAIGVILTVPPTYLIDVDRGRFQTDLFTVPAFTTHVLTALGLYGSVIIIRTIVPLLVSQSPKSNDREFYKNSFKSNAIIIALVLIASWVLLTPRFDMIKALFTGLLSGDSAMLNQFRRVEFATGFFNQKLFTWIRFSISPILMLIVLNHFKRSNLLMKLIASIACFLLYFLMSASFHKSTWFMGIVYIGIFWALNSNLKWARRTLPLTRTIPILFASFFVLVLVISLSYYFQYRSNDTLSFGYHFNGAMRRLSGAVTWAYGAFSKVYPDERNYHGLSSLFPTAFRGGGREAPEREVALDFGVDTTFQPGVLGGMFASLGFWGIPVYYAFAFGMCWICDYVSSSFTRRDVRYIFTTVLSVNIVWILQMPLFPSISSSGILLTVVIGLIVSKLQENSSLKARRSSARRNRKARTEDRAEDQDLPPTPEFGNAPSPRQHD